MMHLFSYSKRFAKNRWKALTSKPGATALAVGLVVVFSFGLFALRVHGLETGIEFGEATGLGSQDIRLTIMRIVRVIIGILGIIALLIVLYGGYVWMTAGGNAERVDTAKKILRNGAIGLVIIMLSFAIATFIINQLIRITGAGGGGGGTPPGPCVNCGHLGNGIIESVFPAPYSRDNARNTNVMVTFKVPMNPSTIIAGDDIPSDPTECGGEQNPCTGNVLPGSVAIFLDTNADDSTDIGEALTNVTARTSDGRTYVFNPGGFLGNSTQNSWYKTRLTDDITKDNGESAFPGVNDFFQWTYEIGTEFDLDPVEQRDVFPQPDDFSDTYQSVPGTQAFANMILVGYPRVNQQASYDEIAISETEPPVGATVFGEYNGSYTGSISITLTTDTEEAQAVVTWLDENGNEDATNPNNQTTTISGGVVNLGAGLRLRIEGDHVGNNANDSWTVANIIPATSSDTLRIGNRTFSFVVGNAGPNEIVRANTLGALDDNIAAKINEQLSTVVATPVGGSVFIQSTLSNEDANSIGILTSGNWANLCYSQNNPQICNSATLSGGADPSFEADVQGAKDQPRNAVIRLDMNEAIDVSRLDIDVTEAGNNQFVVEYQDRDNPDLWIPVEGRLSFSNQYQTIEFLSKTACLDDDGQPIENSCGDALYCLPVNPGVCDNNPSLDCRADSDCGGGTCNYEATQYRVTVAATSLNTCTDNSSCNDETFSQCLATPQGDQFVCQTGDGVMYPEVADTAFGIADAANNSFNANRTTYSLGNSTLGRADGPESQSGQTAYNLNTSTVTTLGDDLTWSFYVNWDIDLTPPVITHTGPVIGQTGVSLTSPLTQDYSKILLSSTLKPDAGYRDGSCRCTASASGEQGTCSVGQICDIPANATPQIGKCKIEDDPEAAFCVQDSECNAYDPQGDIYDGAPQCINRKHITLIDTGSRPTGYWITNQGIDSVVPFDGFGDVTRAALNHTIFSEVTNYGLEVGSGVKDIYQNCYLPSGGPTLSAGASENERGFCSLDPNTRCMTTTDCSEGSANSNSLCIACNPEDPNAASNGCCPVTASEPYCCNGEALSQSAWVGSVCNTGF